MIFVSAVALVFIFILSLHLSALLDYFDEFITLMFFNYDDEVITLMLYYHNEIITLVLYFHDEFITDAL